MERLWKDVRHGLRMLAASPSFTIVAVLSLAIGIGANSAIFSFADALLLRPLPVARPGEVLSVGSRATLEGLSLVSSYRDYADVRDRNRSFEGLGAFSYVAAGIATDPAATPKLTMGMLVSANLLPLMGVEPTIGRTFRPEEDQVPGRDAVVILSRALWEQSFDSDPGVLGKTVRLNGTSYTVIGVAPAEFSGLDQFVHATFFVPLMMSPKIISDPKTASLEARDARNLRIKGRLKPGVSQAEAQAELTAIGTDLERAYPDTNKNRQFLVRTELQARVGEDPEDAKLIAMLSTLAIAVLLVACGNVAGLLASRAPVRAKEMALRLAIGAGRGQLIRQLLIESLLVALMGGLLGLGVGYAGMMLFRQVEIPTDLPISLAFRMDMRALAFGVLVAVASALFFGIVPAIQASRTDLVAIMKAGETAAPGRRRWGRAILVTGQVAVSVVVLVVAMFMYRGFKAELVAGPGYRTDHLMMMRFGPGLIRYRDEQSREFFQQVADRAREVPGVKTVAMTTAVPMSNDSVDFATVVPEGFTFPQGKDEAGVLASKVDEHYFEAMGISLAGGRNFTRTDDVGAPRVGIVNEHFAQHYWPNANPLGKRFRLKDADNAWVEVVGVAKMSKYMFIAESPNDFVYLPYRQQKMESMTLIAQSTGDASALAGPLREVARIREANMPVFNVRTMESLYRTRAIRVFDVLITTVVAMGLMALALALVGLYGLVAYAASRRTREIGIRMAIGATGQNVLRLVLGQGFTLALVGLAIGLAGGMGVGRLLRAVFPGGIDQHNSVALTIVGVVVLAVTVLAAYIPARRASRVNPMVALRYE
jgi:putative ABC transport system permease protein